MIVLLLACNTPTVSPGTVPSAETLPWGVVDSCGAPSGALGDWQTLLEPRLIVHGEGEEALGAQVSHWYPGAGVVAASDLSEMEKQTHHLWLLGGADVNPLVKAVDLPVRFDEGSFEFGGRTWDNPGHGIALTHPSPWAEDRQLLIFSGNTTRGAEALFSIPTGNRDFHLARGSQLEMEGGLCRDGDSWGFFAERVDDYRGDWDAAVADFESVSTSRHVFHFPPGGRFENDLDWAPAAQEESFDRALTMLELPELDHPVHWWMYQTNADKGRITGNDGNAHANGLAYEVHSVYGPDVVAFGAHEDVHILQRNHLGRTPHTVLGEGMAVMVDGNWQGLSVHDYAAARLAEGTLPALADLIDDFWGAGGGGLVGYGAAGSLCAYIRETYGVDALKALYLPEDLRASLQHELGVSPEQLESDWRATLGEVQGWGTLSGDCGVLDTEWVTSEPYLFRGAIDLPQAFHADLLSPGGQAIFTSGTLGGSSSESEALAFDVMHRCEGAELLKTEPEIHYHDTNGKKTDYTATVDGFTLGVSVTRAFHYPPTEPYTLAEAEHLLAGKLADVLLSNDNVLAVDAWDRAMLQVIAYDANAADQIETAWNGLDAAVKDETLVWVTVTEGDDHALY